MARIAVLYSGELRTIEHTGPVQERQLEALRVRHEVAVFVHSWTESGDASAIRAITRLRPDSLTLDGHGAAGPPVSVWLGHKPNSDASRLARGFQAMWTSAAWAYNAMLAEEQARGELFEVVLRCRPDGLWDMVGETDLCISSGVSRLPVRPSSGRAASDIAAALTRADADVYFGVGRSLEQALLTYEARGYVTFVPEFALTSVLENAGVRWSPFRYGVALVRSPGRSTWFISDAQHLALSATRSLMLHGDHRPIAAAEDPLSLERVQSDLELSASLPVRAADLAEIVTPIIRSALEGSRDAARDALRLVRFRDSLHWEDEGLMRTGVALNVLDVLRRSHSVPWPSLIASNPAGAARLAVVYMRLILWRRQRYGVLVTAVSRTTHVERRSLRRLLGRG